MRKRYQPNRKSEDGIWRIRTYEGIDLLIENADVVVNMKAQRIRWIGYIVRTDNDRTAKIVGEWRPVAVKRIGKKRLRWESDVREDLEI